MLQKGAIDVITHHVPLYSKPVAKSQYGVVLD